MQFQLPIEICPDFYASGVMLSQATFISSVDVPFENTKKSKRQIHLAQRMSLSIMSVVSNGMIRYCCRCAL